MPVLREDLPGLRHLRAASTPATWPPHRAALSALPEGQYAFYGVTEGPGGIEAVPL